MTNPALDLAGSQFGFLTVLRRAGTSLRGNRALWECVCICGRAVVRESQSLRSKQRPNPKHCGCRRGEHIQTHGMTHSRPYRIWLHMRRRCCDPSHKDFRNYGARGIMVCPAWMDSFLGFWADMAEGYAPALTLGRMDNNGPYSPENCRWETVKTQSNNTRNNVVLETSKGRMTLTQAAEMFGIPKGTLHARISRYGWAIDAALTTPVARRKSTT